jgi:hypothetical protein
MREKYGIFEIQDVDDIGFGQDCLVLKDEISVTRLQKFEGENDSEKLRNFINQSLEITMNTNCKIVKYLEYKKPIR